MSRCLSLLFLLAFATLATAQTVRTVTITPVGQGGTYNSLAAAVNAEDDTGDLVSRNEIMLFEIDGDWSGGPDTASVALVGWTTDATRYIEIRTTPAARHDGKWNDNKYRIVISSGSGDAIEINEVYTRVIGLQFARTAATHSRCVFVNSGGGNSLIDSCIVKGNPSLSASFYDIGINGAASGVQFRNCLAYDFSNGNASSASFSLAGTMTVNNCTAYGSTRGFHRTAGTVTLNNCLANACTDGYAGTLSAGSNNLTDTVDETAPGSNPKFGTVSFINTGTKDFHLASGDTVAKDQGSDLSGTFTLDIDGQTRSGTWDIGADEYIATGTTKKDAGFFFP